MLDLILLTPLFLSLTLATQLRDNCPATRITYPSSISKSRIVEIAKGADRFCNRNRSIELCADTVEVVSYNPETIHAKVMVKCIPKPGNVKSYKKT